MQTAMQKIDEMTMEERLNKGFNDIFGKSKKKVFEVWTEGFSDTGHANARAMFHGRFSGETFQDALMAFRESLEDPKLMKLVDLRTKRYWGCRFFDNETDARKDFG